MKESGPKVKVAPNSKDSEMMVLGSMLSSINSLNIAAEGMHETDFYYNEHKLIFRALKSAYMQDKPADVHLICEELKREENLSSVGGVGYVTTLAQFAGTAAYIEEYIGLVKNKAVLRSMIHASQTVEHKAFKEPKEVHDLLDEAQQYFYKIGQSSAKHQYLHVKEVLAGALSKTQTSFLKELEERQEKFLELGPDDTGITGVPTHLIDLDKMLNGLGNSNFIILAGRPAMGKTALALNIAQNVCFKSGVPVGIFSLEMSADQLVHRLICSHSEVESDKIIRGSLDGNEYQRIVAAAHEMQSYDLVIDDQPGLKISDLRARARRMKETHNIGCIIIDYMQLLSGTGSAQSSDNRQNEISEISRSLKTLARELDVPVLCLSQLSRRVEERTGHRPMMSDLRESGSIEQDADQVIFILRRDYYDPLDKPGMAQVIVAKNRHGSIGDVQLTFRKEIALFTNYAPVTIDPSEIDLDKVPVG